MRYKHIFSSIIFILLWVGCEVEYIPETSSTEPKIVVESHIEVGPDASIPPYAILTKSVSFYEVLSSDNVEDKIIRDAIVTMKIDNREVELTQLCILDIPEELRDSVFFQFELSGGAGLDICFYVDLKNELQAKVGDYVELNIEYEQVAIHGVTTCVPIVPLDSLIFSEKPGKPIEGYKRLQILLSDPPNVKNFYRYLISINGGPFRSSFRTTADDNLVDGKTIKYPLVKPEEDSVGFDSETYGLFKVGDTVTLKWMTMNEEHFYFWNTIENSSTSSGPFTTYTRIQSNLDKAFGIFGSYSVVEYRAIVD